MDMAENVVELVAQKLPGSTGLSEIDSEDSQGWLLKYRYDSKKNDISDYYLFDWMENHKQPWSAHW